ncbi:MAG: RNA methyltransferase [Psychroflexus sp.]|jgi:tRNA G18 (ribose-2'-O)-methylase SpoU|nr:RNA methyltransferase [Psychroflexus sp.]MDR9448380.1 RNA methyltransferase [Psychroflexus sp.]
MRKLANHELERLEINEFKQAQKYPLILILDNVRSLHNVGALFRTADAFLIEKIYLCGITAQPPHKDIRKTALGATESVAWEYVKDISVLIDKLKNQTLELIAIEQADNAISLHDYQPQLKQKTAMIFGNEVKGVSQKVIDLCDQVLEIPQFGTKHSLNISVSAGVCIWDYFSKFKVTNHS